MVETATVRAVPEVDLKRLLADLLMRQRWIEPGIVARQVEEKDHEVVGDMVESGPAFTARRCEVRSLVPVGEFPQLLEDVEDTDTASRVERPVIDGCVSGSSIFPPGNLASGPRCPAYAAGSEGSPDFAGGCGQLGAANGKLAVTYAKPRASSRPNT